jgi:hypothetical protein
MPVPQIVGLVVAGAGVYAGVRLIVANVRRMLEEADAARAEAQRPLHTTPRDEGPLEWDEGAGVYRPSRRV